MLRDRWNTSPEELKIMEDADDMHTKKVEALIEQAVDADMQRWIEAGCPKPREPQQKTNSEQQ
jgi:hypothetical protein